LLICVGRILYLLFFPHEETGEEIADLLQEQDIPADDVPMGVPSMTSPPRKSLNRKPRSVSEDVTEYPVQVGVNLSGALGKRRRSNSSPLAMEEAAVKDAAQKQPRRSRVDNLGSWVKMYPALLKQATQRASNGMSAVPEEPFFASENIISSSCDPSPATCNDVAASPVEAQSMMVSKEENATTMSCPYAAETLHAYSPNGKRELALVAGMHLNVKKHDGEWALVEVLQSSPSENGAVYGWVPSAYLKPL
jgi:hypothetical protein